MVGEAEAAGEVVTGALLGRALEPRAGEGHGDAHDGICANCSTALIGPHCHQCGQPAHLHRSLGAIGHEILHGVVHFEGKLWRTLPLLAWRPGKLTRRYIDGERARFVAPIALFLFSVFSLFAVFSLLGISPQNSFTPKTQTELNEYRERLTAERQKLVEQRAVSSGRPAKLLDGMIQDFDKRIGGLEIGKPVSGPIDISGSVDTGWEQLDHGLEKAAKDPAFAIYKLQSNSYKLSWLLIPLSLPFLWALFAWRREFHLYDHAVFVTYSIAFMSLLFISLALLSAIGVPVRVLEIAVVVIVPLHVYSQLKDSYRLSRFGAILRTFVLLVAMLFVLLLFLLIILAMGVLG